MAVFPALRPAVRTFTAATYPGAVHQAYGGKEARVRLSNAQTGARLRLVFSALSESEMLSIASHYAGQRGRFVPFALSTTVLDGMANPAALTPAGYQWIYASSPRITDISAGTPAARSCVHDVELELELVPEVSAFAGGADLRAAATIAGGAAVGLSLAPGASWSAAASIAGGAGTGGSTPTDPNFSSVALLLHFGGSTFIDSSSSSRTITASGSPQISTAQSMFGGSSLYLDGSSTLTWPGLSLSGNYTLEAWLRLDDLGDRALFGGSTYGNVQVLRFFYAAGSNTLFTYVNGAVFSNNGTLSGVTANTWFHLAQVRNGTTVVDYINGVAVQTNSSFTTGLSLDTLGAGYQGSYNFFKGYIDEVRISTIARYTTNFTPPSAAFPDS